MADPSVTLTVRLPLALDTKLREIADESDRAISWHVRQAVAAYIAGKTK